MNCKICGEENPQESKFCKKCGNNLIQKLASVDTEGHNCSACNAVIEFGAKFCKSCGHKVTESHAHITKHDVGISGVQSPSSEKPTNSHLTSKEPHSIQQKLIVASVILGLVLVTGSAWYMLSDSHSLTREGAEALTATDNVHGNQPKDIVDSTLSASDIPYMGAIINDSQILPEGIASIKGSEWSFNLLQVNDAKERTILILVTDKQNRVVDGRKVDTNDTLVPISEDFCSLNKKPYAENSTYALAPIDKLQLPDKLWKISTAGKLIETPSPHGLKCGFFFGFDGLSDEEEAKIQESMLQVTPSKPVSPSNPPTPKTSSSQSSSTKSKSAPPPATTKTEEPESNPATQPEPVPAQNNAGSTGEKGKQDDLLGDLFGKFKESVKKGTGERSCNEAERALNQCN